MVKCKQLSELVSSQSTLPLVVSGIPVDASFLQELKDFAAMNFSLSAEELRVAPKEGHLWAEAHIILTGSKKASSIRHPGSSTSPKNNPSSSQTWEKQEKVDATEHISPCLKGLQTIPI